MVKVRDRSEQQRWLTDAASGANPGSLSVTGSEAPQARPAQLTDRV
ncbi:hydrolase [Streptomyces sviceus ATCC 29083]|uniref:Hydrolase n=1 Tax=Streptomyces sviceus (strain ATCC 29083 / DSM 924 / JCM 4929 / NBRC 13980 / NCIMB 11184 / NRRL 5439 / UC 5370) TaxID=463191 RepID=B5I480_STRX2|nr:hydrolase [Streptomyces sviceus ATCC 29083]